eukprot:TRINITY_DN1920_c0_g1_i8.p1 TRINITY_DN1920_c0_g1~~TRINITY_DN1920_c0_g1_i8.p1  ORF type:complete len:190 (-),score=43.82 TRINITY_DN1920_c0_g1_i8:333-902(-)
MGVEVCPPELPALSGRIQGYPSIKYGAPDALHDYEGGREYSDLSEFAKNNLGPTCGINTQEHCTQMQKTEILAAQTFSNDEIKTALQKKRDELKAVNDEFEAAAAALETEYERLSAETEKKITAVEQSGTPSMNILRMVSIDRGLEPKEVPVSQDSEQDSSGDGAGDMGEEDDSYGDTDYAEEGGEDEL